MTSRFDIDPAIARARTLHADYYRDAAVFEAARATVFARSWQCVGDLSHVKVPGQVTPVTLLEGLLDEPLLLTRDHGDRVHALSNVCTHRGALVCEAGGVLPSLRCRYHGRRFGLDGRLLSMPEFEGVEDFPSAADHLPAVQLATWGPLVFASLAPEVPFDRIVAEMTARVGFCPLAQAAHDPSRSRDYLVRAHWALYCENYLEGFHIPYVHAALNDALDYGSYRTELFPFASLQLGVASGGDAVFDIPPGWPDHGTRVAAFYFWLFANTMINVYPWGISVNVVKPLAPDRTKVSFLSYVWDPDRLEAGAGSGLDRVEREDEAVVESVQRGLRSRLYARGRYSVARETGVHHFHALLAARI